MQDRHWVPIQVEYVWDTLLPFGRLDVVQGKTFEETIEDICGKRPRLAAIYALSRFDRVDQFLIDNCLEVTNSPLTDRLRRERSKDVVLKAVLYFADLLNGLAQSLRSVSQSEAWAHIDDMYGDETRGKILELVRLA